MKKEQFEHRKYRGHIIELVEQMGWSDAMQKMVPNGYRIYVEGPAVNINQHTYLSVTSYVDKIIDAAMDQDRVEN